MDIEFIDGMIWELRQEHKQTTDKKQKECLESSMTLLKGIIIWWLTRYIHSESAVPKSKQ